jgi:hypothetical protein
MKSPKWSCEAMQRGMQQAFVCFLLMARVSRITVREEVKRIESLTLHERL